MSSPKNKKNTTAVPKAESSNNSFYSTLLLCVIVAVTFFVFSNTLNNSFVNRDDNQYITENPLIKDGSTAGFYKLFTTPYSWNYHPVTAVSNWLEYKFWKLKPAPYHFFNILLHILNVLLVYQLIFRLKKSKPIALLVAALFAIHPMHAESVAWASERKDLLYTFFALLALLQYIYYIDSEKYKYIYTAFFFFLLSLLSKSAAVIVPLLFLVVDYYRYRKLSLKLALEKIPFFMLSVVFGIVAIYSQETAIQFAPSYTLIERFFLANYCLLFYIVKLFAPANLSCLYPYPEKLSLIYYLSPIGTGLLVFACIKTQQLRREVIFGLLFFLTSLILVIQLLPVGDAVVSERFSYLSYIGLFFIIASFFVEIVSVQPDLKKYALPLLIVCIITLCITTWNRNKVWKNSITLWEDVVEKDPETKRAYLGLGYARAMKADYSGAVDALTKGIALDSNSKELYFNRSNVYRITQNWQAALGDLSTIIRRWPEASIYIARSDIEVKKQDWSNALTDVNKAMTLDSALPELYLRRAFIEFNLKDYRAAIKDYDKILETEKNVLIYNDRGAAYYQINEKENACNNWKISAEMGDEKGKSYLRDLCK